MAEKKRKRYCCCCRIPLGLHPRAICDPCRKMMTDIHASHQDSDPSGDEVYASKLERRGRSISALCR